MQNSGDGGQNVQESQKGLMSVEQTQVVLAVGVDSSSKQGRKRAGKNFVQVFNVSLHSSVGSKPPSIKGDISQQTQSGVAVL